MQHGSPTLLSALKSSSLRASAYGQDFTTSFKEDDMSLLGEFKNAASRFSQLELRLTSRIEEQSTAIQESMRGEMKKQAQASHNKLAMARRA